MLLFQRHKSIPPWLIPSLTSSQIIVEDNPPQEFLDCANRLIIYRTSIVRFVADNMAAFMDEARNFAAACTPFTSKDAGTNVRGNHWFCIAGHDRQNKSVRNHSYLRLYLSNTKHRYLL